MAIRHVGIEMVAGGRVFSSAGFYRARSVRLLKTARHLPPSAADGLRGRLTYHPSPYATYVVSARLGLLARAAPIARLMRRQTHSLMCSTFSLDRDKTYTEPKWAPLRAGMTRVGERARLRQEIPDDRPQALHVERLGNGHVRHRREEAPRPRGEGAACHEHDPAGGGGVRPRQSLVELDARHARHHQIAENDVEGLLPETSQGLASVRL